jgi:hypothetical protein
MPRGTRGTGFSNRRTSVNPFDQKFNTGGLSNDFFVDGSLGGSRYDDFGGYQDIFSPKKKETDSFLKNFISKGLQKPDEDSTASKIAEGVYKSYRPKEKSSQDKISDLLAARMGLGGGSGVQDVAQGLTLTGQGGGLNQPIIIPGEEGSGGIGGAVQGAAGGYLSGGPLGAVIGGIGGLFCDVRVKEDIAPLQKSEVNDLLSECAFFVKDLNECS